MREAARTESVRVLTIWMHAGFRKKWALFYIQVKK